MHKQQFHYDTLVIGGGIAGLWLANRLRGAGYDTLLLESRALGSDQTLASQGMIHGGVKYALTGQLTGASEAIADMPALWRACLAGQGDVDLQGVPVLSDHFYMWASQSITARLSTFIASKALRGRVDGIAPQDYPPLLAAAGKKFQLYKLVDMVLDVPAVVHKLADNLQGQARLIDWQVSQLHNHDGQVSLQLPDADITARRIIFCAGRGNAQLLAECGEFEPAMQVRPLQQVMVKHKLGYQFHGHCLGADKTPRLTISSHRAADGDTVWYLGGALAESGVGLPAAEQIARAKAELHALMPWIDLRDAQWATLNVERAEPLQQNFMRPDQAFAEKAHELANVYVGWPTKLTLAPNMANAMLALLQADQIAPSHQQTTCQLLPPAALAQTPWDIAFAEPQP